MINLLSLFIPFKIVGVCIILRLRLLIIKMVEMHTLGQTLLYSLVAFYLYYTVWIMVMPLIDEDHAAHTYFPDRNIGLTVTTLLAYMLISLIFTMSGIILIRGSTV